MCRLFKMTFLIIFSFILTAQAQIKDITWEIGPNLPEFRKGGCFGLVGRKLISVFGMRFPWGEMSTMYIYDPDTNLWTQGPGGPMGQCYVKGIENDGKFYSVGGRKGSVHGRCFCLSEKGNSYVWKELAGLKESRGGAPSASIGNFIYVFGGAKGGHGPTLSSIEMLNTNDPQAGWKKISDIPGESRGWFSAASVKGKIYLIGGLHFYDNKTLNKPDRKRLNQVLLFDPKTMEWQSKKTLPFALSGMDCCVYKDRYLIIIGGAEEQTDLTYDMMSLLKQDRYYKSYYNPFVLVYDTTADTWTQMESKLPMATNDIRVAILDNKIYVIGGENIEPATSNTTPWLRIGKIIE